MRCLVSIACQLLRDLFSYRERLMIDTTRVSGPSSSLFLIFSRHYRTMGSRTVSGWPKSRLKHSLNSSSITLRMNGRNAIWQYFNLRLKRVVRKSLFTARVLFSYKIAQSAKNWFFTKMRFKIHVRRLLQLFGEFLSHQLPALQNCCFAIKNV